ncbi:hypothetical protein Pst134EA_013730 [Puccinia striiformis f. sp. tritici]|uniref:hypothetical protein n=1 Tax=Puccinia striiformis f. sp. tritici TaxID=168172 RepID=UPI002008D34B|nr:hypothetical protein Pst134EA_013730 [Puccinia striiformis f. sp. tritici]KAH9465869.1 hypothetical protein Pst134EA_013730 [Puccinia striiformis f. sp. tritici]
MWLASTYLIAGITAVANSRAIPTLDGLLDRRQFGSSNSQSSSSSSGFSTSSSTTSDGRVSRTTVYGGTPYTITQSSQSSPSPGQSGTISSVQVGQNPAQIFQDPFPRVPMPFPTTPFSTRPMQSLGMPTQTSTFFQPLPIAATQTALPAQALNPSHAIGAAQIPTGQALNAPSSSNPQAIPPPISAPSAPNPQAIPPPTQVASGVAPVLNTLIQTPNPPPAAALQAQTSKVATNPPVQAPNSPSPASSLPTQASGSPQASGPSQASGSPQASGPPQASGSPQASGPPQASGSPQASGASAQVSGVAAQALSAPPTAATKLTPSSSGPSQAANTSSTASNVLFQTAHSPSQASDILPASREAASSDLPDQAQNSTVTPAATNSTQGLNLPPGSRPTKAVMSNTNTTEMTTPDTQTPDQPLETSSRLPNPTKQSTQALTDETNPAPSNPAGPPPKVAPQNLLQKANTTNAGSVRNFPVVGLPVAQPPQDIKPDTENLGLERPTGPRAPNTASAPATGNGAASDSRLETGTIPVFIESFTAEGRPFRSDGLLKISNIPAAASGTS